LTGTCYNFEMEEFFSSFLRRAGMPASAGLSCYKKDGRKLPSPTLPINACVTLYALPILTSALSVYVIFA